MHDTVDLATLNNVLRNIIDPEIGANIVDLGLIYRTEIRDRLVEIDLTMTSPACPMGEMILDDVEAALETLLPDGWHHHVEIVWEPPWTPERMSPDARVLFGWDG